MHPLIGITGRPKYIESVGRSLRAYAVFHTYTDGVLAAGAAPVMLIPTDLDHMDEILDRLDGVLIPGGGDIDPARYDADPHATVADVDTERDAYELALVRKARERKMPTFAICRGLQVVNVAFGGTLVQDLPSQLGRDGHDVIETAYEPETTVTVEPDCLIADIIGPGRHGVNSLHHQAVDTLGSDLRVVARAEDETIEAIAHADPEWPLLAVQWHPEFLRIRDHAPSNELFLAFIQAAEKYRADR